MSQKSYFIAQRAELQPLETATIQEGAYTGTENRKYTRRTVRDRRAKVRFGPEMRDRRSGAGRRSSDTKVLPR